MAGSSNNNSVTALVLLIEDAVHPWVSADDMTCATVNLCGMNLSTTSLKIASPQQPAAQQNPDILTVFSLLKLLETLIMDSSTVHDWNSYRPEGRIFVFSLSM